MQISYWSAEVQVYSCGDVVMPASDYTDLQNTRGSCRSSCSLSSTGISAASQYYWIVSEWSPCMAPCGGSSQERTASCMNSIDGGWLVSISVCFSPEVCSIHFLGTAVSSWTWLCAVLRLTRLHFITRFQDRTSH